MPMTTLETLAADECLDLLATEEVGRLGVKLEGYPLIIPVNFALHEGRIVVCSGAGAKLSAARLKRVAFEVDRFDPAARTGSNVLIHGFAVEVDPGDPLYDELAAVPVHPWAPGDRSRILLITPVTVSGRRISRSEPGE